MPIESTMKGQEYIHLKQAYIDESLKACLPPEDRFPGELHRAMRYSVLAGGKRLRPLLAITAYETFDGRQQEIIDHAACAIELVHTYSLIHDDLPCMDDDDLRRGRPTVHKQFSESTAVLAGDALHDLAFTLMAETGSIRAVSELAYAIGTEGMIGGQMADVMAEGKKVSLEQIRFIHTHKTGALIRASVRIGAILARVDNALLAKLTVYGEKIGLAFQIIDDILDIRGDQKKLGKMVGSDCKKQKATYPGTVGLEQARKDADQLIEEAVTICRDINVGENHFKAIAEYIGRREH